MKDDWIMLSGLRTDCGYTSITATTPIPVSVWWLRTGIVPVGGAQTETDMKATHNTHKQTLAFGNAQPTTVWWVGDVLTIQDSEYGRTYRVWPRITEDSLLAFIRSQRMSAAGPVWVPQDVLDRAIATLRWARHEWGV